MGDSGPRALAPSPRAAFALLTRRWLPPWPRGERGRLTLSAAAAALIAATYPGSALAADVSMPSTPEGVQMTYTAAPGESNNVTVDMSGTRILLRQFGPATPLTLSAMGDCILNGSSEPKTLSCAAAGVTTLDVTLGDGDDEITNSTVLRARISGADGQDILRGGPANDQLDGGPGPDTISGDGGDDALSGAAGNDTLDPGPGSSLGDADSMRGGDDFDTVSYAARTTPVFVTKDGVADDGSLTERDDVGLDVERINGGQASDTLSGGLGADDLQGGPGGDTLWGGPGRDRLRGGPGRDTVAYTDEPDVIVTLGEGVGTTGLSGDRDRLDDVENVSGSNRGDTVTGSTRGNVLAGGSGEDYLDGLRGDDRLSGGRSADVVVARDSRRYEPVSCGRGTDLAVVNQGDEVVEHGPNGCEQVDDGSRTEPRPGSVYLDPRCGAGARFALASMRRLVPLRYSILLESGYPGRRPPTLDTSDCWVRMTATTGQGRSASAELRGAPVTVGQTAGRRVTTKLGLKLSGCAAAAGSSATTAARRRHVRVRTQRKRRNRVNVIGTYSSGGSEGTDWTTIERCSSTTTRVHEGRVSVYDRIKRKTIIVRAGETYVARRTP